MFYVSPSHHILTMTAVRLLLLSPWLLNLLISSGWTLKRSQAGCQEKSLSLMVARPDEDEENEKVYEIILDWDPSSASAGESSEPALLGVWDVKSYPQEPARTVQTASKASTSSATCLGAEK
ncbi:MAG: hypothetical protein M1818_008215 [Claussenomyces sp. TS43310]|nr:MAG: hypothetical protein M1818_008215 [Claussenomyces sp. TS43310]